MPITASIRRKHWLAIPAVLLLLALIGAPAISRMTCVMSGHVSYAVDGDFSCCADDGPTDGSAIRATCCDFAQVSPEKAYYVLHAPVTFLADISPGELPFIPVPGVRSSAASAWLDSRPPPLPQRSRLARIGSWLI